jgi:hypothetical protein
VTDINGSPNYQYEGREELMRMSQRCTTGDSDGSNLRADTAAGATQNSVTCVSRHQSTLGDLQHLATTHRDDDELRKKLLGVARDLIWRAEMDAWGEYHGLSKGGVE